MARTKADEESKSRAFTRIFEAKPELLRISNFDEVAAKYLAAHPDREFTARERGIAANIKSRLRKKHGIKSRRRRRKARLAAEGSAPVNAIAPAKLIRGPGSLLKLEDSVDECLMEARRLDPAGLHMVIKHLRLARNTIIHLQGEL